MLFTGENPFLLPFKGNQPAMPLKFYCFHQISLLQRRSEQNLREVRVEYKRQIIHGRNLEQYISTQNVPKIHELELYFLGIYS